MRIHTILVVVATGFAATLQPARAQTPLGTGFVYQGQLKESGLPVDGNTDFQFKLFPAPAGGTQIGTTQSKNAVGVVNGLFSVTLDFGASAFNGDARWLEVAARSPAGSGVFTTLLPRQPVSPAPYAMFALNTPSGAGDGHSLNAADGSPTNAVYVNNAGSVGIGTTNPQVPLHVNGVFQWGGTTTDIAFSGEDDFGLYLEQYGSSPAKSMIRLQTSRSGDLGNYSQFFIDPNAGFSFMNLGTATNNVGIGTRTPAAKLDVRGNIRLGDSGEFFAAAGEENLRIVRGVVDAEGNILAGSGFSVTYLGAARHVIRFTPAFSGPPAVTGTAHRYGNEGYLPVVTTEGVTGAAANLTVLGLSNNGEGVTLYSHPRPFHFIAIGPR